MRRQQIDVVSLKKSWLRRRPLCISKIAEAHVHQPVALLGAEIYSVSQLQDYLRQFITGSRRMVRRVAACEDLEFFGLQLETTVRGCRASLLEADQSFSARHTGS